LSEDIYFKFFKETPTPIHIFKHISNDFVLVDYNKAANKLLKGKLDEYLGSKVSQLLSNRPEIIKCFTKCYEKQQLIKKIFKYHFQSIDEPKHVFVEFKYIAPDLILVHYEDITKRKLAEEKLKNSQKKYRSLFNQSPVGIAIFNKSGIVIDCNPMSEKITGYKKSELINRNLKDIPLFNREQVSLFRENARNLITEKKRKISEIQIKKKDGSLSWIIYELSFIKLDKITYYHCIFQDINILKTAEKNLKDSNERYHNLITSVPDIIIKIDHNAKILYINPQVKNMLGYSTKNMIGKIYYDYIHPEDLYLFKKAKNKALHSGKPILIEYRLRNSDDKYLSVSGRGKLIDDQGKIAFLGIIRDISDKKYTERLLEEKLKLESLISKISSRFIFNNDFNSAVQNSLKDMAKFINADRAYLFLFDEEKVSMSNTHEWTKPNLTAHINDLQNISLARFSWLIKCLKEGKPIHILNPTEIFTDIKSIFKNFETDEVKSILIYPIFINEELSGFLGFDDVKKTKEWDQEDLSAFQIPSDIIGTTLERKFTEKTLNESYNFLDGIISSIPSYMIIINNNFEIIWVNDKIKNFYKSKLIGKKCYAIFRNNKQICENCPAQKTLNDGNIHQQQIYFSFKESNQRIISTNSNIISRTIDGKAELIVVIGQDITDFRNTKYNFKLNKL